jgi:predicted unusual protein kinase regulating ubiquinone biosynthesis (AarF/ABC1/UbiB family)
MMSEYLFILYRDIYILRVLAGWFQWLKTTISNQRPYDVALLDAFAAATLKELDYLNEAENQTRHQLHPEK